MFIFSRVGFCDWDMTESTRATFLPARSYLTYPDDVTLAPSQVFQKIYDNNLVDLSDPKKF